jgi:FlaA1/EpsC-like NDP-sugar epimerase
VPNYILNIFPPELLLAASGLALAGFVAVRYRSRLVTGFLSRLVQRHGRLGHARERVLVIGAGPAAQHAAWLLEHPLLARRFQIVGFIDDDLFKQGIRIYGAQVLGRCKDAPRLVQDLDVGLVLVANQRFAALELESIRHICGGGAARLLVIPDMLACLQDLTRVGIPVTGGGGEDLSPCQYCLARLEQLKIENPPEGDASPRLEPRSAA